MTSLTKIPNWLKSGEISQYLSDNTNQTEEDFIIPKLLKLDLIFRNANDIIKCIDTSLYLGLDKLPREIYDFCQMNQIVSEDVNPQYQYFTQTEEFKACQICSMKGNILTNAILQNNMACVRYCIEDLQMGYMDHFRIAVKENHVHICKYIIKQYPSWIKPIQMSCGFYFYLAEESRCDMYMLSFLREEIGIVWPYNILTMAMNHRNIEFAKYAILHGCQTANFNADIAVNIGSLEILKLLAEKNVPMDSSFIFNLAVQFDHLEIAKFLYEKGARPNDATFILAQNNPEMYAFLQKITM